MTTATVHIPGSNRIALYTKIDGLAALTEQKAKLEKEASVLRSQIIAEMVGLNERAVHTPAGHVATLAEVNDSYGSKRVAEDLVSNTTDPRERSLLQTAFELVFKVTKALRLKVK